jgi:tryptophanyl-tRNA synthetase
VPSSSAEILTFLTYDTKQIRQKIKVTYEDSIDNSPKDTKQGAAEDKVVSDFNLEKA